MNRDFYIHNREKFAALMDENATAIFFSGHEDYMGIDMKYPFFPYKNFVYLTGLSAPNLVLVLSKSRGQVSERIYIEKTDAYKESYEGPMLCVDNVVEHSGIKKGCVHVYDSIDDSLKSIASALYYATTDTIYIDSIRRDMGRQKTWEEKTAENLRLRFPYAKIKNAYHIVENMRYIKSEEEIALVREAVRITGEGLDYMRKNCGVGMREYEWRAHFEFVLKKYGCSFAFPSIVAAGGNSVFLHYVKASKTVQDKELVLLDVGAEYMGYCADISRTYPANGVFTQRQKDVYEVVYGGVKLVHEHMKPYKPYGDHVVALQKYMAKEMRSLGLIKTEMDEQSCMASFSRGCCHHLGLDAHDGYFNNDEILLPGMVFTNEPGIYIGAEDIGIRLEEDLLITPSGNELLSRDIAIDTQDVQGR